MRSGRYLAEHIPGARFVELPARTLPRTRRPGAGLRRARGFLTDVRGKASQVEPDRVLATVLFSDIVGSTERAATLGDRGWRELLEQHHALVRRQLVRFRGKEVDTAGDGFFASFDGPARAIGCGCAIAEAVAELGLEVRVGAHRRVRVGGRQGGRNRSPYWSPSGRRGRARRGAPLLHSEDLVAGSGISFKERGTHQLKGIPGEWRLYAVDEQHLGLTVEILPCWKGLQLLALFPCAQNRPHRVMVAPPG